MEPDKNLMGDGIVALICLGMYLCFICNNFNILEENKNRFIFQIQPTLSWATGIFFFSLFMINSIVLLIIYPITVLDCQPFLQQNILKKSYPSCQLLTINLLGRKQNKISIGELQKAIIDSKLDADDDSDLFARYRVVLVTARGNVLFTNTYTYGIGPEYQHLLTVVNQINSFITQPSQDSLRIEQDEKVLVYTGFAISSFFGLVTFLILAMAPYITCSFERDLNLLTLERRNLFKKKIFTYKISDIKEAKIEEQEQSNTYRLTLFLRAGEKVPLTYAYTSGWKEKQQIADRLQNFLGIGDLRSNFISLD